MSPDRLSVLCKDTSFIFIYGESSISLSLNRGRSLPYGLGQVGCLRGGEGIVVFGLGFGFAYWGRSDCDRQCVGGEM